MRYMYDHALTPMENRRRSIALHSEDGPPIERYRHGVFLGWLLASGSSLDPDPASMPRDTLDSPRVGYEHLDADVVLQTRINRSLYWRTRHERAVERFVTLKEHLLQLKDHTAEQLQQLEDLKAEATRCHERWQQAELVLDPPIDHPTVQLTRQEVQRIRERELTRARIEAM